MKDKQRRAMFFRLNRLKIKSNRLPVQFSIIVPSTDKDKKISASRFNKRIDDERRFMSRTFGGDTSIRGSGDFELTEKGKKPILIKERIFMVESSTTPKKFNESRKKLITHLKDVKKKWKQNSILFKVEGESFIFPKQSFIPDDKSRRKILIS